MKQINYIFVLTFLVIISSFNGASAHETDTLRCNLLSTTPFLYPFLGGGHISGNNSSGDLEIAQKYGVEARTTNCAAGDSTEMSELAVWFGAKTNGTNDSVRVRVYSVNPIDGSPDQILTTSFPLLISNITTSTTSDAFFAEFLFPGPIYLTDSFFVSVVLPDGPGDAVSIISNTDGDGQGRRLGWIRDANGNWDDVLSRRGLDIDFAIFPTPDLQEAPLSVNDLDDISNEITVYPNPANEKITIEFGSPQSINQGQILISTIQGKIVKQFDLNNRDLQNAQKVIDTADLPSGTYFYTLLTNDSRGQGKFVVTQ